MAARRWVPRVAALGLAGLAAVTDKPRQVAALKGKLYAQGQNGLWVRLGETLSQDEGVTAPQREGPGRQSRFFNIAKGGGAKGGGDAGGAATSKACGSRPALGGTGLEAPQCPPPAAPAGASSLASSSAGEEDIALAEPSQLPRPRGPPPEV